MTNRYSDFGIELKKHRQAADETLEELAQAVELDLDALKEIELGHNRPSEDILALLISHFELGDHEATTLWKLAGYVTISSEGLSSELKDVDLNIPSNQSILYTDMVNVVSNKYGIVLNFVQGIGPDSKPIVVSRVGMSKEHAKSIIEVLQKSLDKED